MNWLVLALLSFAISSLLCFIFSKKNKNKKYQFHRMGGLAIIISFIISFLFSEIIITSEWQAILIGSMAILFFGIRDDFRNLSWKRQLFFQLFLALILIYFGYEINQIAFSGNDLFRMNFWQVSLFEKTFSVFSSLFIIFWLMILINAINWLDGSDGLLSITGILSLLAVLGISLRPEVNQPALIIVSLIGIGSLSGFLIFNFPKAKIEAGTSGSYFVGFLLASLAIIAGTNISTTMIILILPVTDFIWVMLERFKEGQSVFQRDDQKRHLHYKLLAKGLKPRQILLIYVLFLGTALVASFFVVNQFQKIILLIVEFLMILILMFKLSSKISMKRIVFKKIFFIFLFLLCGIYLFFNFQSIKNQFFETEKIIKINGVELGVKLADTTEEAYQGLGEIKNIPDKTGMLFLYQNLTFCSHVMRGMLFDLDFVFMQDGEVVFIKENVSRDFKGSIQSPQLCNQVLEINAGEVEEIGIKIGDKMEEVKKNNW